jgi:two-component system, OmpR family, phosphate regulon sensor histidine kinase PhoR
MRWVLPRLLLALASMAIGGLLGMVWMGRSGSVPGILVGGACAAGLIAIADRRRGHALLAWLRRGREGSAPRDGGLWGEIGYRIERALRAAEQETRTERMRLTEFLAAIEASPNGVMLLDAHNHIEWLSSRAADHFALDPQRDRRQRVTNLVRAPAFVAYLQAGHFEEPVVFQSPRGRAMLSVLAKPYANGMKLVISTDRTEEERTEAMRRDFVANVSHEIRTPLTVLTGFLETMTNLPLADAERHRVLALMSQQTARMAALVDNLLTLARLEGSPRPAPDRWVALHGLLALVEGDARALSGGRHNLSFSDAGSAEIAGEQAELFSAVTNLVNNAVRYTPQGGTIDVTWRVLSDGRGEIAVTDTGRGIEREHIPRLTERFYRVDGSRSRETGGTGLGLSIVKHVVQRHGGELAIESALERGSTFRLLFPAARVRRADAAAEPPPALSAS